MDNPMNETVEKLTNDVIILWMLKAPVELTVQGAMRNAPYSRLSSTRIGKVGYRLMCLRAREIGVDEPTRQEAMTVEKTIRADESLTNGERLDIEEAARIG